MIALAESLPTIPLAVSGRVYEIDYETGMGLSRKLIEVDRIDSDDAGIEAPEVFGRFKDSGQAVSYSEGMWEDLRPQLVEG